MTSKAETLGRKISEVQQFFSRNGFTWKHYKGGVYRVDTFTILTDDGEVGVVYHRIAGPDFDPMFESGITFTRPFAEWNDAIMETTTKETFLRFVPVSERQQTVWIEREVR